MKADIFFFVTTAVVVILAVLAVVALVYVVRILKNVFYISKLVRDQSDETSKDITDFRHSLKEEIIKARGRARSEGEEVMSSFSSAHGAVRKEAGRIWDVFTFLFSFIKLKGVLKSIIKRSVTKKRNYDKKNKPEE